MAPPYFCGDMTEASVSYLFSVWREVPDDESDLDETESTVAKGCECVVSGQ